MCLVQIAYLVGHLFYLLFEARHEYLVIHFGLHSGLVMVSTGELSRVKHAEDDGHLVNPTSTK